MLASAGTCSASGARPSGDMEEEKKRAKKKEEARTIVLTFFGVGETLSEKGVFFTAKKGDFMSNIYTFDLILVYLYLADPNMVMKKA